MNLASETVLYSVRTPSSSIVILRKEVNKQEGMPRSASALMKARSVRLMKDASEGVFRARMRNCFALLKAKERGYQARVDN